MVAIIITTILIKIRVISKIIRTRRMMVDIVRTGNISDFLGTFCTGVP